jgi:hypothetical protein
VLGIRWRGPPLKRLLWTRYPLNVQCDRLGTVSVGNNSHFRVGRPCRISVSAGPNVVVSEARVLHDDVRRGMQIVDVPSPRKSSEKAIWIPPQIVGAHLELPPHMEAYSSPKRCESVAVFDC